MEIIQTDIPDIKLLNPSVFEDARGSFHESFNKRTLKDLLGEDYEFVQDNHSCSNSNVLRGLHYQLKNPQAKLVRVIKGEIYDVAVDIRKSSSTFGKWVGHNISEANRTQIWIPSGFAHGYYVISEHAEVLYKTTDYYNPDDEYCICWDDPDLSINWPIPPDTSPNLSDKDLQGLPFNSAIHFK